MHLEAGRSTTRPVFSMDEPKQRGGAGRGQGRKPLPDDQRTVVVTVRLTPGRRDKLRRLGAKWLATAVDAADEPGTDCAVE